MQDGEYQSMYQSMIDKRNAYALEQMRKNDERKNEIVKEIVPQVDAILKHAGKQANIWRKPMQIDLSLDQPYKDEFDKLMLKLLGDYPDQAREILDRLIERAVLSLPYIENTSEYPFHLWVKITEKSPKMARIQKDIQALNSNLKIKCHYDDSDYLDITNPQYDDYRMRIYIYDDLEIQIGNFDDDCDEDDEPTTIYSAQDAKAVKYFADLAHLIMQKEGR